jgi:hypothetical protein
MVDDLDESIQSRRRAVQLTPEDHLEFAGRLYELTEVLINAQGR